ncbi:MAG: hypothetical protein CM15mP125_1190 [Gammaproteobacteria bacterium]|nr:MAG: hypothetical protein CM15mP125_1190 [Gammaproteobacteria bacterium]
MTTLYLRDRWFEDLPVGEFHVFGSHTFSELEIVEFAQTLIRGLSRSTLTRPEQSPARFDRQPMARHGDVDAQDGRLHGGICAGSQ